MNKNFHFSKEKLKEFNEGELLVDLVEFLIKKPMRIVMEHRYFKNFLITNKGTSNRLIDLNYFLERVQNFVNFLNNLNPEIFWIFVNTQEYQIIKRTFENTGIEISTGIKPGILTNSSEFTPGRMAIFFNPMKRDSVYSELKKYYPVITFTTGETGIINSDFIIPLIKGSFIESMYILRCILDFSMDLESMDYDTFCGGLTRT